MRYKRTLTSLGLEALEFNQTSLGASGQAWVPKRRGDWGCLSHQYRIANTIDCHVARITAYARDKIFRHLSLIEFVAWVHTM